MKGLSGGQGYTTPFWGNPCAVPFHGFKPPGRPLKVAILKRNGVIPCHRLPLWRFAPPCLRTLEHPPLNRFAILSMAPVLLIGLPSCKSTAITAEPISIYICIMLTLRATIFVRGNIFIVPAAVKNHPCRPKWTSSIPLKSPKPYLQEKIP